MPNVFRPLISGNTTAQSPNVGTIMDEMDVDTYYIPDYQRDSEQWNISKRSLFIESLINNLTIPPLIVYPEDDPETGVERRQIIDGQQRLTTIRDFVKGGFALAKEEDVEYAENVGPLIQGKKYDELPPAIQSQIRRYTLNLIVLPKRLELGLRLEIFRRINEGGVPLSPQDLRLATFGHSERVYFIRLAGIFDPSREGASRMIKSGTDNYDLGCPWKDHSYWQSWWEGRAQAAGQASSQMFLFYVVVRDLEAVGTLLNSEKRWQALGLRYDKTVTSVLDLYCAQAQSEQKPQAAQIVADLDTLKSWFDNFEQWFNAIKGEKVPKIAVNSATKLAAFIAHAAQTWESVDQLTEAQWEQIQFFLTKGPNDILETLGMEFSSSRGKWPGQKKQFQQVAEICQKIAEA